MALDLELKTRGVWTSYLPELVDESLTVEQTGDGLNSTCSFDLIDRNVIREGVWTIGTTHVTDDGHVITGHIDFAEPKSEVRVTDGATVYFAGILSRMDYKHFGAVDMLLHCDCHDFNQMLEESVVDDLEVYGAKTDEEIIDDIFPKYVTGIGKDAHVNGPFLSAEISFGDVTVRSVLDTLASKSQYKWYVGYDKELYYDAAGADAPAWHLSDRPDGVNSFAFFDDISVELDATNLVNMVFIIGAELGLWFQDEISKAKYGEHKAIIRDTNLIDIEDMEYRAEAILVKHRDPIATCRVKTYKDGLRAGMNIRLVSSLYNVDDTFLINSLTVTFPVDGDPVYEIECGGLRSSTSAAAQRFSLDDIQDPTIIPPGQLPLASRGWGHDLEFTSTDHETVEWTEGTITTAGGQEFAIAAGDTDDPGAMAGKIIVFLDLIVDPISPHDLQITDVEVAAFGIRKIPIAVCWPGIAAGVDQPEVLAGFQVFGSTTEVATYLNATNVIADCITANHIATNTITATEVAAHTLTGDEMGFITLGANTIIRTAASPAVRIEMNASFLAGYSDAVTKQFWIQANNGKGYFGGGGVSLEATGLNFDANTAAAQVRFIDAGNIRGYFYSVMAGNQVNMVIRSGPSGAAGANAELKIGVMSQDLDETYLRFYKDNAAGEIEAVVDLVKSVVVTKLGLEALTLSTDWGTIKWKLGGINMTSPSPDRCVEIWIGASKYLIAVEPG